MVVAGAILSGASAASAEAALRSDFNGDGYDELVVGVPGHTINGIAGAGAVVIVPGSPDGIAPADATQILQRGQDGVPGEPLAGEQWGTVLQTADFNGDGFFDLAVASPRASVDGDPGRGDVVVFFGSRRGLRSDLNQHIVPDAELGAAAFGAAIAVGLFDRDPLVDLAIGAPTARDGAGIVVIYHSSVIGRLGDPAELDAAMAGEAATAFGAALAAAPSGAGLPATDDLVIGAGPAEGMTSAIVYVARQDDTAENGLTLEAFTVENNEAGGLVPGRPMTIASIVAGDFNADGVGDVVFGLPLADLTAAEEPVERGGALAVYTSNADGWRTGAHSIWRQEMAGFQQEAETGDEFGTALAVGDFNGDDFDDLAIGAPFEDDFGIEDRGAVHVLYGTEEGFTTANRVAFHFDLEFMGFYTEFGERGESGPFDLFAGALGAGDFNGDGMDDLAVGILGKAGDDGEADVGWVLVMRGSPRGTTTAFARLATFRTIPLVDIAPEAGARFGFGIGGGAGECWLSTVCRALQ